jgi:ankyrin repeat protein
MQAAMDFDLKEVELLHALGYQVSHDHYDSWPLHFIALCPDSTTRSKRMAQWLLQHGDSVWNVNLAGYTPLHLSAMAANDVFFTFLLEIALIDKPRLQALLNQPGQGGRTIAHLVCLQNPYVPDRELDRVAIVKRLMDLNVDFTMQDASNYSAVDYAKEYYPYLKPLFASKNLYSNNDVTCDEMQLAIVGNNITLAREKRDLLEVVEEPAPPLLYLPPMVTPLHQLASVHDNDDLAIWLILIFQISRKTFIDVPDVKKIRPLHLAAAAGHLKVFKLLLSRFIEHNGDDDINQVQDFMNRTPAHAVCSYLAKDNQNMSSIDSRYEIIELLGEMGADFLQVDGFGITPMGYALVNFPDLVPIIQYYVDASHQGDASIDDDETDDNNPLENYDAGPSYTPLRSSSNAVDVAVAALLDLGSQPPLKPKPPL